VEQGAKVSFGLTEANWTQNTNLNFTTVGFTPSWYWRLETPSERWPLRGGECAECVVVESMPVSRTIIIGFCAKVSMSRPHYHALFPTIRCHDNGTQPRPERARQLQVAAFPQFRLAYHMWQHQILEAAVSVGLSAPLLDAGYTVKWLHAGVLNETQHNSIRLRGRVEGEAEFMDRLPVAPRFFRDFVLAWTLPAVERPPFPNPFYSPRPALALKDGGFNPTIAYRLFQSVGPPPPPPPLPLLRLPDGAPVAVTAPQGHDGTVPQRPQPAPVALILRTGPRAFVGEAVLVHALRSLFDQRAAQGGRRLRLDVINGTRSWKYYARVAGLIGVHGGALANVHAMPRNATVIEIIGRRPLVREQTSRSYANLALAIELNYYVYFAKHYPCCLETFHAETGTPRSRVEVDVPHLIAFVDQCFFGSVALAKYSLRKANKQPT